MVVGDGTCCFRVLFEFAVSKLGYGRSFAVFCRMLASAALEATAEAAREVGEEGIKSDSAAQLQRIKQSRNPERDLQTGAWEYIEAEQVLRGFVQVFPQASLRRFTVYRENVVECEVYGAGDVLLCVLQWHVLPHYDELV